MHGLRLEESLAPPTREKRKLWGTEGGDLCAIQPDVAFIASQRLTIGRGNRAGLESVPAVGVDNGADDLPPSFQRDVAAVLFQLSPGHRIDTIAFAEGGLVEAIGLVEHDFVLARWPSGALCRAVEDFNELLARSACRVRDHHDRVRAPAQVGLVNLPGGHGLAPLRAAARRALNAPRPTVSACLSTRP